MVYAWTQSKSILSFFYLFTFFKTGESCAIVLLKITSICHVPKLKNNQKYTEIHHIVSRMFFVCLFKKTKNQLEPSMRWCRSLTREIVFFTFYCAHISPFKSNSIHQLRTWSDYHWTADNLIITWLLHYKNKKNFQHYSNPICSSFI